MKFVRSSTPHPARPHRSASVRLSDTIRPHPPRFKRSPVQLTLRHHTPMAAVLRRRPSPSPFVTFPSKPPFWSLPAEEFDREVGELLAQFQSRETTSAAPCSSPSPPPQTPTAAVPRRRPSPSPFVTFPSKPPSWSLPAEELDREVDELLAQFQSKETTSAAPCPSPSPPFVAFPSRSPEPFWSVPSESSDAPEVDELLGQFETMELISFLETLP